MEELFNGHGLLAVNALHFLLPVETVHPDPSPATTSTLTHVTGSSGTPFPPSGKHGDGELVYEVGGGQLGHEMTVWHPAMNSVTMSTPNPLMMSLPLGTRRAVCITLLPMN